MGGSREYIECGQAIRGGSPPCGLGMGLTIPRTYFRERMFCFYTYKFQVVNVQVYYNLLYVRRNCAAINIILCPIYRLPLKIRISWRKQNSK
jgi:hypothetical protein